MISLQHKVKLALTHKFPAEECDLLNYFHSQKQPSLRNKELCNYTEKARSGEVNTPVTLPDLEMYLCDLLTAFECMRTDSPLSFPYCFGIKQTTKWCE